ncbi:hypothetical protein MH928_11950 [Flavobacterium sp. WW92]|uniref:hypothetical protein n=1 Tax=unclassified Flavobacterium TaxID=196869 RepID=UPI002224899A|nr:MULTISPECIES: hypothetical protein [unclassified Flavobacterium]WDO12038.1 hypothetical protein MH928_11950 [Flavobacterium sp. WW92]
MQIKNIEGLSVAQIKELVNQGAEFVYFPYTVSFVLGTVRRASSIYFIRPYEGKFKYSYKHVGVNALLGWWGIPWGPIYTIGSMYHQLSGGKDVTHEVLSDLIQNDPDADTSTYNINGLYSANQSDENPTYNIPR